MSLILAFALGMLVLSGWYFVLPTWLTVAVTAEKTQEAKVIAAYARGLGQAKKHLRLRLVEFPSYRETAEALERGTVDLALVRPDIVYPRNGLTTVILREEALMIVAPSAKDIDRLESLNGKQLGVLARDDADLHIFDVILDHFGMQEGQIRVTRVAPAELASGNLAESLDALAFVATPHSEDARRIFQTLVKVFGPKFSSVALEGLEPVTALRPGFRETTVAAGALSSNPKFPREDMKTASISYRLVASDLLDRIPVSSLVQHLIEMRPRVAREYPSANLMKQPPTEHEMSAALPNHRGAIDYFNREQQTFMDRWGDWLWLGLFAVGGVTSIFAWFGQLFVRRRQEVIDRVLDRLLGMIPEARTASMAELNALGEEIDDLVTYAVRHARWRTTSARTMSALAMALDGVRAAITERRYELEQKDSELVPGQPSALRHEMGTQVLDKP
jgi:TRAP-type uncharacterized transport system substrate-binding protein